MKWWKRMFTRPCKLLHDQEADDLRAQLVESNERVRQAARKVARAAETVSQQRKENEMAEQIARFRRAEGGAAE